MIKLYSEVEDSLFNEITELVYKNLSLEGDVIVELLFYDEDSIHKLNLETRGVDKSTDVLSYPNLNEIKPFTQENYPFDFDMESNSVFLGSIVICDIIAKRQAEEYGHSECRERAYLFLHGLLHLLGYDHIKDEDKQVMRAKEEEILNLMGVSR